MQSYMLSTLLKAYIQHFGAQLSTCAVVGNPKNGCHRPLKWHSLEHGSSSDNAKRKSWHVMIHPTNHHCPRTGRKRPTRLHLLNFLAILLSRVALRLPPACTKQTMLHAQLI